jgi:hypothetical protein
MTFVGQASKHRAGSNSTNTIMAVVPTSHGSGENSTSVLYLSSSQTRSLAPARMCVLFVGGFGYLAANTAATTQLQGADAEEHRGRIMALELPRFG